MHQALQASRDAHAAPSRRDVLSFLIHNQRFGLPIHGIKEIVTAQKITPLPRQSPGTLGLIHLRKQNIPVLNLNHRMGLAQVAPHAGLMIVLESDHGVVSICVSAVEQIHHIQSCDFSPNPNGTPESIIQEVAQTQYGLLPVIEIGRLTRAAPSRSQSSLAHFQ